MIYPIILHVFGEKYTKTHNHNMPLMMTGKSIGSELLPNSFDRNKQSATTEEFINQNIFKADLKLRKMDKGGKYLPIFKGDFEKIKDWKNLYIKNNITLESTLTIHWENGTMGDHFHKTYKYNQNCPIMIHLRNDAVIRSFNSSNVRGFDLDVTGEEIKITYRLHDGKLKNLNYPGYYLVSLFFARGCHNPLQDIRNMTLNFHLDIFSYETNIYDIPVVK
ncbi:uncharacterized protein LOC135926642 [Gordionus sp. m RMFG-2023]|uniref:uncharacterized protein LOC135926642 n=1 Tax=Gordionus sp. m RMFG-2023 TaxID=3053472 RepID=UPI0031FBAC30